ncbi:hypothetical protein HMPREF6485_0548 [Segatella buccae ATCC 33574]|uniref:Uncharacterized protein n=1 Tax=Segatella buccae ATCC 33574 TaxID=873513 RepID=E6K4U8_9BACT|nr:hypothetical protein HMPREF6485_0548 [Segatella buccae ATCC 33574]
MEATVIGVQRYDKVSTFGKQCAFIFKKIAFPVVEKGVRGPCGSQKK